MIRYMKCIKSKETTTGQTEGEKDGIRRSELDPIQEHSIQKAMKKQGDEKSTWSKEHEEAHSHKHAQRRTDEYIISSF